MNVLERVIQLDQGLFFRINGTWNNSLLDFFMPLLRESLIWVPLYLFMLVFIWMNFGVKGLYWAAGLICTAALCDIISSHLIKEMIYRNRPCRNPDIADRVRFLVSYCGKNSSFVSSHAANHFGVAMFVYRTMRKHTSPWVVLFFAWAAVIAYAQVYVGVHFPFDVACGALTGCFIGFVTSRLFNKNITLSADASEPARDD